MSRLIAALVVLLLAAPVQARPLVADLSEREVAITAGFSGAKVLAFGALDQEGDVVVVVRGPLRPVTIHRKARVAGIWINVASMTFDQVPSFYAVASSRPLEEMARSSVLAGNRIGVENLNLELPRAKASPNVAKAWRDALIRNQERLGLYRSNEVGKIRIISKRLFSTRITFPANVPTGAYLATTYLLVDGRVESAESTKITVNKVGIEAEVFDFAHEQSALYGIIAILIALVAGWLAHVAFREA
jgi:uncharacterized protein (TIGR02186 family)